MIGNITTGSSFSNLFHYLLATNKGASIIGGNVISTIACKLAREFQLCANLRPTTAKPVKHISIAFAPEDGQLSNEMKTRIADRAVRELGYTSNQYAVIAHHRQDPGHDWEHCHDHMHIAINMIGWDGKRTNDSWDKRKLESVLRKLEIEENLTQVMPSTERTHSSISHGQTQRYKRELKEWSQGDRDLLPDVPLTIKLQAAIDAASCDRPTMTVFIGRLQHLGINVHPSIAEEGRKGITYQIEGLKPVRGCKLHNASFPKLLTHRGISFDPVRDREALDKAYQNQTVAIPDRYLIDWNNIAIDFTLDRRFKVAELGELTTDRDRDRVSKQLVEGDRSKVELSAISSQQQQLAQQLIPLVKQIYNRSPKKKLLTSEVQYVEGKNYRISYERSLQEFSIHYQNTREVLCFSCHQNNVQLKSANITPLDRQIFQAYFKQQQTSSNLER